MNFIANTFQIAFSYDVSIDGGNVGVINFPRAPIIPAGAMYESSFFKCTTSFVSAGGGTFDLESNVEAFIFLNILPVAGHTYQGHIPTPPLFDTRTSDGSALFVTVYTAPLTAGAGIFFMRYTTLS